MDNKDLGSEIPIESNDPTTIQTSPPEIEPPQTQTNVVVPAEKKKSKKIIIIVLIAVLVSFAVGASAMYIVTNKPTEPTEQSPETNTSNSTSQSADKSEQENPPNDELERFLNPTTGEVWYDDPIEITQKGWFVNESDEYASPIKYFEIGSRGENKIVITVIEEIGSYIEFYEVEPDGEVRLIKDISSTIAPKDAIQKEQFIDSILIDEVTHYDSMSIPVNGIKLDSGYIVENPASMYFEAIYEPDIGTTINKEMGAYAGDISKYETTYEEPGLTKIWFEYKLKFGYSVDLVYEPFDTNGSNITWNSGDTKVDAEYSPIVRGCGSANGVSKAFRIQDSDLKLAGTNTSGQEVYELVDNNYKLLTKVVEEYNEFYSYTEGFQAIDKQTLAGKHGLIFYKDSIGNWLVYTRDDLSPAAGCAKPVIYLYPEVTTDVRVKVGADVKISDPLYTDEGWNVLAQPNGNLTVNGQNYSSLFWEGPGKGQYPGINSGKIVETKDAIATISNQLRLLGLNQNEISDFVDYWQDKLPNKPYTRLTWLTTQQLNQLAPLYIYPKPDTVIRVFLDYSGLDEPYELPEQTLTSIPRDGFTVVEWGGLSPRKLY